MTRVSLLVGCAVALAAIAGCRSKAEKSSLEASVVGITTTHGAELFLDQAPPKGALETVDVDDDRAALVVIGDGEKARRPILHLHGTCAVARTDVESWSSAARAYGTVIALEGDTACPDGIGGRTWHADAAAIDTRIDAAIDAIRTVRGVPLDQDGIVIVADDIGASQALALAARAPAKYTRLVLNGLPDVAPAYDFSSVRAIAVLATDREPQDKSRRSFESFTQARVATKFWTLSGATHSDYGVSGARTIGEALAFVTQH